MFFGKKKKEEVQKEKLALLYEENIKTGCAADTKENIIKKVGGMLVETGYVNASYVDAMLEREKTVSTFMGSGLALPHGVEAAKKEIKESGIAVMVFPEGTDWGGELVNVVIGIAGVGEEHLQILSVIAEKVLDETTLERLVHGSSHEVYEILKREE